MAVGQIASGDRFVISRHAQRRFSARIRFLSRVGLYPRGQIDGSKGVYYLDEKIGFIVVRTDEQRAHKYWSEVTLLAFEEIRFLSALLLSMRPDNGVLFIYPGPAHITNATSDFASLCKKARRLASKFGESTPLHRRQPYRISGQLIDAQRYRQIVTRISIRDHLMLRGLSAILKADMLQVHNEFREESQSLLFVAMEVAFRLTLRLLREQGIQNPSSWDAGEFVHATFPNNSPGMRFFEEYYDDRNRTFHPEGRLGTFAFPPLLAGDFYGLRAGLISMFQYLITRDRWYTLWD